MPIPPRYCDPWPRPTGFHVISVASSLEAPGSTYGPWKLDRWGLAWIMTGSGTTFLDDEALQTGPDSVLFVEAGRTLRHDWGKEPSSQVFAVFGWDELPAPWPPAHTWPRLLRLPAHHFMFALWRYLRTFELERPEAQVLAVPLVELMLRMFVSEAHGEVRAVVPALPEQVERAVRIMAEHMQKQPDQPLRLGTLAKRVHVTEQHLCRLFKDALGLGPIECAQALRLELASGLLERSELGLAQIAEKFGFSSQFHFSRAFKQAYGMSPRDYRQAFRQGAATRPPGLMFRHHALRHYFYEAAPGKILKP